MSNNLTITENPVGITLRQFRGKALWTALATLIDCEGNISIRKSHPESSSPIYTPYIKVGNSSVDLLTGWMHRINKGTFASNGKVPDGAKPMFRWEIARKADVVYILKHILPYMVIKREQAQLAADFIQKKQVCKLAVGQSKFSRRVPEQELAWREESFKKMQELNARGIPRDYTSSVLANEDNDIVPPTELSVELDANVLVQ